METAEMRRSTLQRKDREELTMIATTLGKKPASRARKGEIIDLILDLAAGGDGSSVGDDTANGDGGADPEGANRNGADDKGSDAKGSDGKGSDGKGSEAKGSDDEGADAEGSEAKGSDDEGADAEASDGKGSDAKGADDDKSESSGRKRRRRGRDREPNKDSDEQWDGEPIPVAGHLELRNEGYGFLRVDGALPSKDDAYVPVKMVRQFGLRKGDHLAGTSRPANRNEKNPAMIEITSANGGDPATVADRVEFDALPVVYPSEPIVFAGPQEPADPTARVIDLLTPFGKGQRALLAGATGTGKTTLLQHLVRSLETNHEDLELLVLLLDERPETSPRCPGGWRSARSCRPRSNSPRRSRS